MHALRALLDLILPPRDTARVVRTLTYDAIAGEVSPTYIPAGTYESIALLPYHSSVIRALILEAKFHNSTRAHHILGTALTEYLLESEHEIVRERPTILVPIPLSPIRQKERGYNQVEQVLRAHPLPFPVDMRVLTRVKNTVPQTRCSESERRTNVMHAFTAHHPDPQALYIVVDDVTTTGATLIAAADALTRAGAQHVLLLALAH